MNMSIINLNNDLNKIRNWAIQWKMNFNADPSKQSQEVTFSKKLHNSVYFNQNSFNKFPLENILKCILILN